MGNHSVIELTRRSALLKHLYVLPGRARCSAARRWSLLLTSTLEKYLKEMLFSAEDIHDSRHTV